MMIHIYRNTPNQHNSGNNPAHNHCNVSANALAWLESADATTENIEKLAHDFNLPADFLTDALDLDERPRFEQQGDRTLIMIHVPYDQVDVQHHYDAVKYRTIPLAMIISPEYFITVCKEETAFQPNFFKHLNATAVQSSQAQAALNVLAKTAEDYSKFVQHIERSISNAEDELSRSYRNQELYALLYLNESLLYVTTSLKQLLQVVRKADLKMAVIHQQEDQALYAHSLIELEQVAAVAEINQLNLNNVMDAYGNVIQNNVSHVVKLLTAVTIVLSIPTLIASVYGMNVPLPFQEADHAFSVIVVAMVVSSALVAYYFHKKQYF